MDVQWVVIGFDLLAGCALGMISWGLAAMFREIRDGIDRHNALRERVALIEQRTHAIEHREDTGAHRVGGPRDGR